jgi:hypothetical protein
MFRVSFRGSTDVFDFDLRRQSVINSGKDSIAFKRQVLDQYSGCGAKRELNTSSPDTLLGFEPVGESIAVPVRETV